MPLTGREVEMWAILVCLGLIGLGVTIAERSKDWDQFSVFAPLFVGVIGTLVWVIATPMVYTAQADDVATVRGQQAIVAIYEARRGRLYDTLKAMDYPKGALLNADSPVKAIADSIAATETMIAEAQTKQEQARIDIQARKLGLFGFVVSIVGEE